MRRNQKGFTLMELMVVIIIVAILAAVAVPLYINYVRDAQRTEARGAIGAVITAEQRRLFDRQGYLVIDPQVPDELIERIKADVEGKYNRLPAGTPGYPCFGRIQDAWEFSDAVRQVVVWPRVLQILRELYGRDSSSSKIFCVVSSQMRSSSSSMNVS